ncbi:hypothetical protein P692DRAFT_20748820 [Suillus brevipes Sb2]|nr:hypothetical protein P692DRAFT_20748820 [Suillus brevipes Sb2]
MHLSLSLIDDSPRQDFAPRQRHTLKEFAAIVMREMELWRDKVSWVSHCAFAYGLITPIQIQLRI